MTILHRIYFVWVALLFILTMLLAFILIMAAQLLPKRAALRITNTVLGSWAFSWGTLVGLRFKQYGREAGYRFAPKVIITNHNSFLDTVVSYICIRGPFRTLAKKELLRTPVMGPIFTASGIMVDRSSPESRKASYERMVSTLRAGTSLLIYPEGTQNRTNEFMQPFYDGAFKAAIGAQVPILPIVTVNARQIMPQAKFLKMRPGRIRQYFLPLVETKGLTEGDVDGLRERVRGMMIEKLKEVDPGFPN